VRIYYQSLLYFQNIRLCTDITTAFFTSRTSHDIQILPQPSLLPEHHTMYKYYHSFLYFQNITRCTNITTAFFTSRTSDYVQILPQPSLLPEHHTIYRYYHSLLYFQNITLCTDITTVFFTSRTSQDFTTHAKCHFTDAQMESVAIPSPIFMKAKISHQQHVQVSVTDFT
jgi:hypothetical protein